MIKIRVNRADRYKINECMKLYSDKYDSYKRLTDSVEKMLVDYKPLKKYVHSIRSRTKEPDHLKIKLEKKANLARENGEEFLIDSSNLFDKIEDLAGVRIIHLHTEQIVKINEYLLELFEDERFVKIEGPIANIWDLEAEKYYDSINFDTKKREDSLYTSVHYVYLTGSDRKCEVQVRTLSEEIWGEVSHQIDYPIKTKSIACREQILALARVTSSSTRLVDSIFRSFKEYNDLK